jgi:alpha-tubulin suppressor-like RCC1 family protein
MTTKIYGWGNNPNNLLGVEGYAVGDAPSSFNYPVKINDTTTWSKVFLGARTSFAIKNDGTLWFAGPWGWFGYSGAESGLVQVGSATWSHIAISQESPDEIWALGIKTNGTLWFVGSTNYGIRGNGTASVSVTDWVQIGTDTGWTHVAAGRTHAAAVNTYVYTWGDNSNSRSGNGSSPYATTPTRAKTNPSSGGNFAVDCSMVACSENNTFALGNDGIIYACGVNTLNIANWTAATSTTYTGFQRSQPTALTTTCVDLDAGAIRSACAVTSTGELYNWGANKVGSTFTNSGATLKINNDTTWANARVSGGSGGATFWGRKSTNEVYSWGFGSSGSLGTGSSGTQPLTQLGSDCTALAIGGYFNMIGTFKVPTASFTKTYSSGTVVLTNTSTDGRTYLIDWGDGTTSTIASNAVPGGVGGGTISHSYSWSTNRTFTIALYAYSSTFLNGSKITGVALDTVSYTLYPPAPAASFTSSLVGYTVTLTNTSTNGVRYLINWGDETSSTIASNAVPGGVGGGSITHTYEPQSDSKYTITLTAYSAPYGDGVTLSNNATTTNTFYLPQSPTFTVVEQGTGPTVIVRNTSANTLGATAIFGSGNKWRWDWGDGTYTDVDSGSGLPGARLVNLEHLFSFSGGEIAAQLPVTRTITLKAYNGDAGSPFSSNPIDVTVIPVNPSFPNTTFTNIEEGDIPAIFNAPRNITWGKA